MLAPLINTDRLILRPLRLDDFDDYAAMWRDPRVTAFIGGDPRPRDEAWRRFCQSAGLWALTGYGYWLFEERITGQMAGVGGLASFERGIDELVGYPEAGWSFTADHWGRGLASEAVSAICHWSDTGLNAPEIRCIIDPKNAPSIRVAEKSGFALMHRIESNLGSSLLFRRVRSG
jgi:RimJ/RimL family protein N-acetyltransferase